MFAALIFPAFAMPAHATTVAGATTGQIAVTPAGAAQYTVPIVVPPGIAGIQPRLALNYNSQGTNGLVGMGWNLSGLSAITRCPKTLIQDGLISGINYDGNDKFCIDGHRLVAIAGTYGADGTEYRAERDTFSRIISHGTLGTTGPAWFQVWTKSGQILEYGNTADSGIEAQGKTAIRVWAVNKISDIKSNYLTATYTEDNANGQYYPARIDYTGNIGAGLATTKSVRFVYAVRPDVVSAYQAGSLSQFTVVLSNIQTYVGTALVEDYRLAYNQGVASQRSRLISLMECDGAATANCLNPTAVISQAAGGNANTDVSWGTRTASYNPNDLGFRMGDVNGDGLPDIVYDGDGGYMRVLLNTGNGSFGPDTLWATRVSAINTNAGGFQLVDLNGDGLADVVYDSTDAVDMHVMLSNGVSFGPDTQWGTRTQAYNTNAGGMRFADVNGDGLPDLVYDSSTNGSYTRVLLNNNGTGFGPDTAWGLRTLSYNPNDLGFRIGDVNGDGLPDIVYDGYGGYMRVLLNTGNGSFGPDTLWATRVSAINTNAGGFQLVDLNGDGLADVVYDSTDAVDMHVMLSNGVSFGPDTQWGTRTHTYNLSAGGMRFADVNGDGFPDLIYDTTDTPAYSEEVLLNNHGSSLGTDTSWGIRLLAYNTNSGGFQMADLNGDGIQDLIYDGGTMDVLTSSGKNDGVATAINNGLGVTFTINYKPLTNTAVYTKDTGPNAASYPVQDIQNAMYVVSSISSGNGIGGSSITNYNYVGAKSHLRGGGFLGFRKFIATDAQTGIKTTTTYGQGYTDATAHPCPASSQLDPQANLYAYCLFDVALPKATEQDTVGGAVLNQISKVWGFNTNPSWGPQYRVTLLTQANESSYELASNGATQGPLTKQTTTCKAYDSFGNSTYTGVWGTNVAGCTSPPAKTGLFVNETNNTYFNDTANWFLGRLTGSTVTNTTP